jgi:hypothetical protein
MERIPKDGGQDSTRVFLICAYFVIALQPPLYQEHKHKLLVANTDYRAIFEVFFTAALLKIHVFWKVTLCRWVSGSNFVKTLQSFQTL